MGGAGVTIFGEIVPKWEADFRRLGVDVGNAVDQARRILKHGLVPKHFRGASRVAAV